MKQLNLFEKQESLEVLNYQIRACKRCRLSVTRKHALTGEGNLDSSMMFVALSPGALENLQNQMFVGPSGQVFNKLLRASEIARESVFMTNLVKCMIPKNRKPSLNEIESCAIFLDEEISIIQPEIIVPLGVHATNAILNKHNIDPQFEKMSFTDIIGRLISSHNINIFPLPHPASILYNPSFEPDTIRKYKKLKSLL